MKKTLPLIIVLLCLTTSLMANSAKNRTNDREYWSSLAYKMAKPVLKEISRDRLQKNMDVEYSPQWNDSGLRDDRVAYMEAFGRLMSGIAPWLALEDDNTQEGKQREELRELALKGYAHAVDPKSKDYLLWRKGTQPLVDAAYIASSFLRAPEALWEPLDKETKERYIEEFKLLRRIDTPCSNWMLFSSMIEVFLMQAGEQPDIFRINMTVRKLEDWYVGDGWYSDGDDFVFNYYNSFVLQPMYVQVLKVLVEKKTNMWGFSPSKLASMYDIATKRMQRYSVYLERFISPEGAFPIFGRSMTYRLGIFQPISLLALKDQLPETLSPAQVRCALTCSMKRMFESANNFNKEGYLILGFAGHQTDVADYYSNSGSMYITSEVLLPLGLPAEHKFWTSPAEPWTSVKAWSGEEFPKDGAVKY